MRISRRLETMLPDGRRASVVPADAAGKAIVCIIDTDPWSALWARGLIEESEYRAACDHAYTWDAAGFVSKRRSSFEGGAFSIRSEPADRLDGPRMDAWRRWRSAQACVPAFARGQIYAVVAFGETPTNLRHLRIGLRALARFYRT